MNKHKTPGVTADIILNYYLNQEYQGVILIKRKNNPFKNHWALPGGFLECGRETIEEAAIRETMEETSLDIKLNELTLLGVYSTPGRDPRGHTVSLVYYANVFDQELKANDDALEIKIFKLENLPNKLAFDHKRILEDYIKANGGK